MENVNIPDLLERLEKLEKENAELKEQNKQLAEEKCDLEMLMEMTSDHADEVGHELLDKANFLKELSYIILETVPVPIIVSRVSDSTALYLNDQCSKLFGRDRDKVINKRVLDFFYKKKRDRKKILEILNRDGCLNDFELEGLKADGTSFTVRLFSRSLIFENEPCILTAFYDETERKQAEAEIHRLQEELERRKKEVKKFLVFDLCGGCYGIDVPMIKEITETIPITDVPNTPAFVKGVINLRGSVVPVIDMRLLLGLEKQSDADDYCVIVVEADDSNSQKQFGLMVDAVSEVIHVIGEKIKDIPSAHGVEDASSLFKIVDADGCLTLIIDIQQLCIKEEFFQITESFKSTLHSMPFP